MSGACKSLDTVKARGVGTRKTALLERRLRRRLAHGVCYKLLTVNLDSTFRLSSTINGCGEILMRNSENRATGVANSLKTYG